MHLKCDLPRCLFLAFSLLMIAAPVNATNRYAGACLSCTYPTISAAIADCVAGDRVYVSEGVYNEHVDLNTMSVKGDIRLIANGSVTINPPLGKPGIRYDKADAGDVKFPGNITIDGFNFAEESGGVYLIGIAGDAAITECAVSGVAGVGIWAQEVDGNVTIRRCTGNNVTGLGFWVTVAGGDVMIEDCIADNFTGIGIWIQSAGGNVSVMDCSASHGQGIGVWMLSVNGDLTIQNCNMNFNFTGLSLDGLSAAGSNSVMCCNLSGNADAGLDISNGTFALAATNNWWGDVSGPGPVGSGNAINENPSYSGVVAFDPWLQGPFESASGCRAASIPAFNEWGVILLSILVAAAAFRRVHPQAVIQ